MTQEPKISVSDFAASFKGFLDTVQSEQPVEEPRFTRRLREHFEADPARLAVISEEFPQHDHPNVHLAIESLLNRDGAVFELIGVTSMYEQWPVSLATMASPQASNLSEAPVDYINIPLNDDRVLACVQRGLYLVRD